MDIEAPERTQARLETVDVKPRPRARRSWRPKWLPPKWWTLQFLPRNWRIAAYAALGVLMGIFLLLVVDYWRLARMADRRLADGPFAMSTEILASPETIASGESLTAADLVRKLERSGYTRSEGDPEGWFSEQSNSVQITPGPASAARPVEVRFAQGTISSIVSLAGRVPASPYQLDPQLLTDLSENREKRRLVRYSDIPPSLVRALTAVEDKRFFHHGGFDYRRIVKAALVDFKDGRKQQGASTLTMQLARALWLHPQKSWRRKFDEILITVHLEHVLSKQQIFEDYANEIYLGMRGPYSINGFGEAARDYFGKELSQIDTAEAALLAGMVQRPSYFNPYRYPGRAIGRRNLVLEMMKRNRELSDSDYRAAAAAPLKLAPQVDDESEDSYFLSMMNEELQSSLGDAAKQSHTVVATLDPQLQRVAESAVRTGMQQVDRQLGIKSGVRPQVALVALDPHTGEIKALIGGRNYRTSQLNHALASRQPGSAFKPFVYAAAIETAVDGAPRTFTPASVVSDEATTFAFGNQLYQPHDMHDDYQGDVTLRTALAESLNVASVSLAEQVGYGRVVRVARAAGLNGVQPTPSAALGSYEVTPLDLASAYTIFANGGVWVKPTTIDVVRSADGSVLSRHQAVTRNALDPRVAYVTLNMMEEVLRSGTGASARSRGFLLPAAGKTGTSRDGWFAGFTSNLLCVVWVGFDDNRDLKLEGAVSALPIWTEFMKEAAQIAPYRNARDFSAPAGIVTAQICSQTGQLAAPACPNPRTEVFIDGTEPTTLCTAHTELGDDQRFPQ